MSHKRNRSVNWDEEEKQLLRSVLKEYAQIIESKSLDTNTNKTKSKAWGEVHKKFNQLNSRPRELNHLKIQWKTMKMNARKICSTFKKEVHKTGGGIRPATPDDSVIEVKDLLNPAELLRDHNLYDSDGIIIGELELPPSSAVGPIKQDIIVTMNAPTVLDINNTIIENQQLANMSIEITDGGLQEIIPSVISQDNSSAVPAIEKTMDSLPVKMSEDDGRDTPKKNSISINSAKKVPKRKIIMNNNIGNGSKSRKGQEDYVSSMLNQSKRLKDEEHMRRMEMAEEQHAIQMQIHTEKLKSAILEREILELRKAREVANKL